jgi:ornithine racemase
MAFVKLYRDKLRHNHAFLEKIFSERKIEWGVVTKMLCGNPDYLREVLNLGVTEIHDSRISNLKAVKKLNPDVQTVYIKPPAKRNIPNVVRYADVSFNTELSTMQLLSAEAVNQGCIHKVIIMIEMGDLREGVLGEELMDFYASVFELPNLSVVGIGTNLNCLHGVMPSQDKLIQLSLYKQLIDAKFNCEIPWISGGTTVTIPLLLNHQMPAGVNHFRVGEGLYFGKDLFSGQTMEGMVDDVFRLYAEIIELTEKPRVPVGVLAENPSGHVFEVNEEDIGKTAYRAILDVGLLDVNPEFLIPDDDRITVTDASSDMLVIDLGDTTQNYEVGDLVSFKLKYMGALSVMNSDYIEKTME